MASFMTWHGTQVTAAVIAATKARLVAAALLVEGDAKRSMAEPKSGAIYVKPNTRAAYQASAPGEAPAVRTTALKTSITHEEPFRRFLTWHCFVGPDTGRLPGEENKSYPMYLELGTRKMKPRPYLRPALDRNRGKIKALFLGTPLV